MVARGDPAALEGRGEREVREVVSALLDRRRTRSEVQKVTL